MDTRKKKTTKKIYNAKQLDKAISYSHNFLTPTNVEKLSLNSLKDGSNHFLVAVAVDVDTPTIGTVIIHLMALMNKDISHLTKINKSIKKFKGYTVITRAAQSFTVALTTIFENLRSIITDDVDKTLNTLANKAANEGPWAGVYPVHFAAIGASLKNLMLLHKHGADLTVTLPKGFECDELGECGGWNIRDILIKQWSSFDKPEIKTAFLDLLKYFEFSLRDKQDLKLVKQDIRRKHQLTEKQFAELDMVIAKVHSGDYTLPTLLVNSRRPKRKVEDLEDKEAKKPQRTSKCKEPDAPKEPKKAKASKFSGSQSAIHIALKTGSKNQTASMDTTKDEIKQLQVETAELKTALTQVRSAFTEQQSQLVSVKQALDTTRSEFEEHKKQTKAILDSFSASLNATRFKSEEEQKRTITLSADLKNVQTQLAAQGRKLDEFESFKASEQTEKDKEISDLRSVLRFSTWNQSRLQLALDQDQTADFDHEMQLDPPAIGRLSSY